MNLPLSWPAVSCEGPARLRRSTLNTLIESLQTLIQQSTEALGSQAPSTLMLKQQLAAMLVAKEKPPKVFWMQSVPSGPEKDEPKK